MLVFFLPFIVLFLFLSIRIVQQYETALVFTLGRYARTLNPGLNFIIPLIEWSRSVDMRVLTRDIPKQQVITKDNVPVTINGVVYFRVLKAEAAILEVQDYNYALTQYAQAALRDVVGGMTFDDLLAERQKIGDEIEKIVAKQSGNWGPRRECDQDTGRGCPRRPEEDDVASGLCRT